ncbi:MAG: hypothetical protein J2O46_06150, partial [Nocardioides sp.]|nr:hypothetical protein [Nocardioides sp.]
MATTSGGRRAGSRRGVRPKRRFRPAVLYYVLGILASLIIWGVLVKTAVGFGGDARDGDSGAWIKLLIAALAAIAFMFLGFMLIGRLWHALTGEPDHHEPQPVAPAADAYVEDQGFYDPSPGYGQTDQYSPYENPYADPYGADTPEPFGPEGGKRPSYGVGNNRLPRRQSPPALPP